MATKMILIKTTTTRERTRILAMKKKKNNKKKTMTKATRIITKSVKTILITKEKSRRKKQKNKITRKSMRITMMMMEKVLFKLKVKTFTSWLTTTVTKMFSISMKRKMTMQGPYAQKRMTLKGVEPAVVAVVVKIKISMI